MTAMDALKLLNVRDLQVIVAIAQHKTLTAAAPKLELSQSSLSRVVSRLEKSFNIVLFARNAKKMELTDSGRKFVAIAERVVKDLELTRDNIHKDGSKKRQQILIAAFPEFAQEELALAIAAYRNNALHENTEVHVKTGRNSEVIEDVVTGAADFGIAIGDDAGFAELNAVTLRRDTLCALIPKDHRLGKTAAPLPFSELHKAVMVSLPREAPTRIMIDNAAFAGRIALNHAVIVTEFSEQIAHSRAGVGISIVPRSLLRPWPDDITVRPLRAPQLHASISLFSLTGRQVSQAAASFRAVLIEKMRSETKSRKAS